MSTKRRWLPSTGESTFQWWLRLVIAAVLLATWVAVGLGSGIAHADDTSPSSADSSSESSAGAPKASKADPPKRTAQSDAQDAGTDRKTESQESSPRDDTAITDETASDGDAPVVDVQPSAPASVANAESDDPPEPRVRHNPRRLELTNATAKPARAVADEPQPVAIDATSHLAAVAPTSPPPEPQPVAAKIASTAPAVSSTQSDGTTIRAPQTREIVGLISDVGVVAASVVYTVADTIAQAFGPHSFLGVPYALASAVANSAAAVSRTLIGAPLYSAGTGPFPVTYGIINGLTFFNPQQPPPGANDPSITVTAEHPLPIILINGTTATQGENWGVGAPVLANAGYKVYTFNYGNITDDPNYPDPGNR